MYTKCNLHAHIITILSQVCHPNIVLDQYVIYSVETWSMPSERCPVSVWDSISRKDCDHPSRFLIMEFLTAPPIYTDQYMASFQQLMSSLYYGA